MPKAYVIGYESRPKHEVGTVDVDFAARPEKAHDWGTKEEAQSQCKLLESFQIKMGIPLTKGRFHVCKGFQVDEWESGKFVVFCEVPFTF